MNTDKLSNSEEKIEKVSKALEEARKMQEAWMNHGLDFVDLYGDDIDNDDWEKWGEDEEASVIKSVTAFLASDDPAAVKVREKLKSKLLSEIAVELEKCLNISEEHERLFAVKNVLAVGVSVGGNNRNASDEDDEIELLYLAEELLDKLA